MKLPQLLVKSPPPSFPCSGAKFSDLFSHLLLCHLLLALSYFSGGSDTATSHEDSPPADPFRWLALPPLPGHQYSSCSQGSQPATHLAGQGLTFSALLSWAWKRACCAASLQRPRLLTLHASTARLLLSCSKACSCSCLAGFSFVPSSGRAEPHFFLRLLRLSIPSVLTSPMSSYTFWIKLI